MTNDLPPGGDVEREIFKRGTIIFKEGDQESHFFIVEAGEVQIYTLSPTGQKIDICVIKDGESFGEFALLDRKPRSASAIALVDTSVIRVSEAGYQQLLEDLPVWASAMLGSFMTRMKNMNELLKNFALK